MNRWGWIATAIIVVVLSGYLFWPNTATEGKQETLLRGNLPDRLRVISPGLIQDLAEQRVLLQVGDQKLDRPSDPKKVGTLWRTLCSIPLDQGKAIESAHPAEELRAFGIDGKFGIVLVNGSIRWGVKGESAYIFDSARKKVFAQPIALANRLAELTRRLDDPTLIRLPGRLNRLEVASHTLEYRGEWLFPQNPERPFASLRVERLLNILRNLRLETLTDAPAKAPQKTSIELGWNDEKDRRSSVKLEPDADGARILVKGLPAQRLGAGLWEELRSTVQSFEENPLLDVSVFSGFDVADQFEVRRGNTLLYRLERRGLNERQGDQSRQWQVVWPGGAEDAQTDAGIRFEKLLVDLRIGKPTLGPLIMTPMLYKIEVSGALMGRHSVVHLAVDGQNVGTQTHHGTAISLPPELADPRPDHWLDRSLIHFAPDRVEKMQRVWKNETAKPAEVFRRSSGSWFQVVPVLPVPPKVESAWIQRQLRLLAQQPALSVKRTSAQDLDAMSARWECELALRLAARNLKPDEDAVGLDEALERDWALRFFRQDNKWMAIDAIGLRLLELPTGMVENLFAPVVANAVLPLQGELVLRLTVRQGKTWYVLQPTDAAGTRWNLKDHTGASSDADPVQVRRWLQLLSDLTMVKSQPKQPALTAEQCTGSIEIALPSMLRGEAILTLRAGSKENDGLTRISVETTEAGLPVPPGIIWVQANEVPGLIPPLGAFAVR